MGLNLRSAARFAALSFFSLTAVSLVACKPDAALEHAEVIGKGTRAAVGPPLQDQVITNGPIAAPAGTGFVTGTIRFVGKVPPAPVIDTSMDPACSLGSSQPFRAEQYVVNNGKLANVFLYIKSGPPAAMQALPQSNAPVVLDQKNCRYIPHVIGVVQGGTVEFQNSDPTMHNIHTMPTDVGNETIDVSQGPHGAPVTKQLGKPELMMPVRCNNHPWMNAFLNVSATPFFAVSDSIRQLHHPRSAAGQLCPRRRPREARRAHHEHPGHAAQKATVAEFSYSASK